jgi:hypothetical protein
MTTFDERERSYEAKFARDEELRFKATARRNKALGAWAAAKLGITGLEAEDYIKEVIRSDFKHPGDSDIIEKVIGDFRAKGVPLTEQELKAKLVELMAEAVAQIEAGR